MQLNITGHHVEITPSLRDFTNKKFARLVRHFDRIISIEVIFELEKLQQVAKATILAPKAEFHADAHTDTGTEENLYSAIDALVDKLDKQIKKHKEKH